MVHLCDSKCSRASWTGHFARYLSPKLGRFTRPWLPPRRPCPRPTLQPRSEPSVSTFCFPRLPRRSGASSSRGPASLPTPGLPAPSCLRVIPFSARRQDTVVRVTAPGAPSVQPKEAASLPGPSRTPPESASGSVSGRSSVRSRRYIAVLEGEFGKQRYIVGPQRVALAVALGLTVLQVKVWFQKRRIKWRKDAEKSQRIPKGEMASREAPRQPAEDRLLREGSPENSRSTACLIPPSGLV
ncbi:homeobox protein Hox-B2-like [Narcine bancroftii]|uniref:homeobox protein Hox-B2-like n=1 Tax=Narcine bancroftii TaxID=1343680 RepID=UPI003831E086